MQLERAVLDVPDDAFDPRGHIECRDGTIATFWSRAAGYQMVAGLLARRHIGDDEFKALMVGVAKAKRLPERIERSSVYYTPAHARRSWGDPDFYGAIPVQDIPRDDPLARVLDARCLMEARSPSRLVH